MNDITKQMMDDQNPNRPYFLSTKTYGNERGYSVAYRQWRADTHCNLIHGYALGFHFEFKCYDLDARNWCVDFGGLRTLKECMDDWFDHTCLVAQDDPEFKTFEDLHNRKMIKMTVVERTGCEGLAKWLSDYINEIWIPENGYKGRVTLHKVEVRETGANSAMYVMP
jgi:6-pyruvoyltetrahydropterin/6-carboxytetrahydropterin synthase